MASFAVTNFVIEALAADAVVHAATVAPVSTVGAATQVIHVTTPVALKPLIEVLLSYVNAFAPVLAVAILGYVGKRFGLADLQTNDALHDMLARAVKYGLQSVETPLETKDWNVNIANQALSSALGYAVNMAPDLLVKYGVDPVKAVHLMLPHLPLIKDAITQDEVNRIVAQAKGLGEVGPNLTGTPVPEFIKPKHKA